MDFWGGCSGTTEISPEMVGWTMLAGTLTLDAHSV
jgi:hypothetical protein